MREQFLLLFQFREFFCKQLSVLHRCQTTHVSDLFQLQAEIFIEYHIRNGHQIFNGVFTIMIFTLLFGM